MKNTNICKNKHLAKPGIIGFAFVLVFLTPVVLTAFLLQPLDRSPL